ncbi:DUF2254 domain-containing protein [Yoonia litorea]|uniref:Uncharacterized membrane protein n=1 Tax=Yoonia litorea TaxID=1123755 RepID=A0A1I6LNP0_9RHOB|nr:DUF2254 domain-containing protein [Yoonia litorea]SFS05114.1 Uncharacterized membrane protein [Yoonia litorea]
MNTRLQWEMGKRAFLWKLLTDVRASYWFVPTVLVWLGLGLAFGVSWIDRNPDVLPFELPPGWTDTQAEGARATLSVVAQAIIGIAGTTFSMTLVAVSFASGKFGPRLIGNFMRDRGNQWSLGILIATFVYALVILRTVQESGSGDISQYVPQHAVLVAMLLSLICVFTLIYFIHHVPETINVSRIAASISIRLDDEIRRLVDERAGNENEELPSPPDRDPDLTIEATNSGYLQTVNFERLSKIAGKHDGFIRIVSPVGSFLTERSCVFEVWHDGEIDDDDLDAISGCYVAGMSRTESQNPVFLAEQLVEMIGRALSPGINDPYTAVDCLNRLAAALTLASTYNGGLQPAKKDRLSFPYMTFEKLFAASFPNCWQYIKDDKMTASHAEMLLTNLHDVARDQDRATIEKELKVLRSTAILARPEPEE